MKRWQWWVVAVVVLPAVWISAQAPLPTALMVAERVWLFNAGADREHFDHLANEIRKQQRFKVVADMEDADIVLGIALGTTGSFVSFPVGNNVFTASTNAVSIAIVDTKTGIELWADNYSTGWGSKRAVGKIIERLHERIDEEPPPRLPRTSPDTSDPSTNRGAWRVVHDHRRTRFVQGCQGEISISPRGVRYETDDSDHAFSASWQQVELVSAKPEWEGAAFSVVLRGDRTRTFNFRITAAGRTGWTQTELAELLDVADRFQR